MPTKLLLTIKTAFERSIIEVPYTPRLSESTWTIEVYKGGNPYSSVILAWSTVHVVLHYCIKCCIHAVPSDIEGLPIIIYKYHFLPIGQAQSVRTSKQEDVFILGQQGPPHYW